ncbi:hypothetical protein NA56DRAFT_747366 [Hyaloscypha hepaticicola]|uniref:SGNH hydrolase-type esterase domain-containing protein n=1 Tax=Hyaloscypha hepaticicola TaxID=2082293 RepID=A0A2J6Q907_9HELO|nr:hypothetical protein NA56DRAFT_747366 [Hyaloscypha hepaticicola]
MAAGNPVVNQRCNRQKCLRSEAIGPSVVERPTALTNFEWGAFGDSWTSGVAYSAATVYRNTDFSFCYRTTEAWGAQMEADTTWTKEPKNFHFAGCGGTLMNDVLRQMGLTGNPVLIAGTLGGNDAYFGGSQRKGSAKKNRQAPRDYINDESPLGLKAQFKNALDVVFDFKQKQGYQDRFDLYVSSYVEFFDATTDACDDQTWAWVIRVVPSDPNGRSGDDWTFARWFSVGSPNLVKALRAEMNDLVQMYNSVQATVIASYPSPIGLGVNYYAHYIPVSDEFETHRFCEQDHSFEDQWTSSDWNDGDTGGPDKPPTAPNWNFPVMSLDTLNRTALDDQVFSDPAGAAQSGFGWTARPFHPKPLGHQQMKEFFIQTFKNDEVPGVIDLDSVPSPTITSAPSASVNCGNTSPEDSVD